MERWQKTYVAQGGIHFLGGVVCDHNGGEGDRGNARSAICDIFGFW